MTWSIERLEDGYGIVETNGEASRTVYLTKSAKDAKKLIQMAEVYELLHAGAPIEALPKMTKRRKA